MNNDNHLSGGGGAGAREGECGPVVPQDMADGFVAGVEFAPAQGRVLAFDPEEFAAYFEGLDYTKEEQAELLNVLWNIVNSFVDLGFGLAGPDPEAPDARGDVDETAPVIEGEFTTVVPCKDQFNKAARDTTGKPQPHNRRPATPRRNA